jgi:hypothetical protein
METRSDKKYEWKKQLDKLSGANVAPVVESPSASMSIDSGSHSNAVSLAKDDLSSESGDHNALHSFVVQITELPPNPPVNTSVQSPVKSVMPTVPTPDQPMPIRSSCRNLSSGMSSVPILERAMEHIQTRDNAGNFSIPSSNSFSVLADDDIMSKALELGIASMNLE